LTQHFSQPLLQGDVHLPQIARPLIERTPLQQARKPTTAMHVQPTHYSTLAAPRHAHLPLGRDHFVNTSLSLMATLAPACLLIRPTILVLYQSSIITYNTVKKVSKSMFQSFLFLKIGL
jgi:hypothetical protein